VQDQWEAQLEYAAPECFVHVRMEVLFDLAMENPDSLTAVQELRAAPGQTEQVWYQSLANECQNALMTRLFHLGADTSYLHH